MTTTTRQITHISHSQVSEFTICPRKYHLHRRLGLQPEFCPSALALGSAVHEAIARYHQMRLEGGKPVLDDLLSAYRKRWSSELLPIRLKARESVGDVIQTAERILGAYCENPQCAGQPLAVEEPFTVKLDEDLPPVRGVIDLMEFAADGRLVLSDFETAGSRTEPDPAQLTAESGTGEQETAGEWQRQGGRLCRYLLLYSLLLPCSALAAARRKPSRQR